ncbi:hypothetical protein MVEN_01388900 [Mycena venus]|uniref:Uncharacterized protein n=1 Tax=Mycena venus TaxID=2733690 RepID=A0A8H7CUQ1_9AGAR|nr:hypothetical protein MVEN_01388900 [Mycena venus]
MYSIFSLVALCLAVSARPTFKNRQFLGHAINGVDTGISCTIPQGCVDGDIASCINGEFIISQACADPQTCLELPINNSTTDSVLACSTTDIQTALFAEAFGGIDKIPQDRRDVNILL